MIKKRNKTKKKRHPELVSPKESPKGIPSGLWTASKEKIPKQIRNDGRREYGMTGGESME